MTLLTPRFVPFEGDCPSCGEHVMDLVDFGMGVGESPAGLGHPPTYHWYIVYGTHYGGDAKLCPFLTHESHCTVNRCDKRLNEKVYAEE